MQRTHDYMRHGTTTLLAVLDIAAGKTVGDPRIVVTQIGERLELLA